MQNPTELRQKLIDELTLLGRSPRTISAYVSGVRRVAVRYRRRPDLVSTQELRALLIELCSNYSPSTLNQIVSAWLFFYGVVLDRDLSELKALLPRQRKAQTKVRAYSKEEIHTILYESRLNLKHQALLSAAYHAGLRVSELGQLRIDDIQTSNAVILVRQGKGKKDRYTLLPERLLTELRDYFREYRPAHGWLFTSFHRPAEPLCRRTTEAVFYKALERCGMVNRGGIHCLRHSFATHHLQDGMDIVRLQQLLGHRSLATTAKYLHILSEIPKLSHSPLDSLESD